MSEKTMSFGARQFVITDREINKLINIIQMLDCCSFIETKKEAIELLQLMQANPENPDGKTIIQTSDGSESDSVHES